MLTFFEDLENRMKKFWCSWILNIMVRAGTINRKASKINTIKKNSQERTQWGKCCLETNGSLGTARLFD